MSVNFEIEDVVSTGGNIDSSITKHVSEQVLLSTGIRVGTLVKTKSMSSFISRTRPDGLHIIDVAKTLQRIELASKFISNFDSSRVVVYSSREYGKTPVVKFTELTGTIPLTGRFMPGTLTNPSLPYYIEPKLVLISDPQVDEQAITEATNAGIPVIGIANTDNITSKLDVIIPANNRGRKALATVYWLLVRQILIERGELKEDEPMKLEIDDFETKIIEEEID